MAGTKRQSPGVGHNSNMLPAHSDVRTAMAIELVFANEKKKLNERHKRARKRIEGMGIPLSALSFLKEAEGMTSTELEQHFRLNWHLAGAIHQDAHEQLDIFAPKPSAPERRAAHFTQGLLVGLKGEELVIPPMVVGDDRNQMIAGHNEGRERYAAAMEAFAAAENGEVVDGTGKKPSGKAAKVAEQAEKDFVKDQGDDPLVVNGERYGNMRQANAARARLQKASAEKEGERQEDKSAEGSDPEVKEDGFLNDPAPLVGDDFQPEPVPSDPDPEPEPEPVRAEEPKRAAVARPDFNGDASGARWSDDWQAWSGSQLMECRRWIESLPPAPFVPPITHEGVVAYFNLVREEQANRALAEADDDFEMSDEERAAQTARPQRQAAETPSPEEIEAGAKKLAESGFVPPKATRARKPRA